MNVDATTLVTNALRKLLSLTSTWDTVAQIIDDMPSKDIASVATMSDLTELLRVKAYHASSPEQRQ